MSIKAKSSISTLTASAVASLTAGTNEVLTLAKCMGINTDASPRTITVYHDPTGGGGAVAGTIILSAFPLQAGETRVLPISSLFLANGGKLWALADVAAKVNLDLNYTSAEQTP